MGIIPICLLAWCHSHIRMINKKRQLSASLLNLALRLERFWLHPKISNLYLAPSNSFPSFVVFFFTWKRFRLVVFPPASSLCPGCNFMFTKQTWQRYRSSHATLSKKVYTYIPKTSNISFYPCVRYHRLAWNRETQWPSTLAGPPPWPSPYRGTNHSLRRGHRDRRALCAPGPRTQTQWETHRAEGRHRETRFKTLAAHFPDILLSVDDALTLPFSNLLTLFLLMIMSRSPVSPRSPITLRKTLASVPLPLTLPVQIVTRYFITEKGKQTLLLQNLTRLTVDMRCGLTGQRLFDVRSGSWKLSDDLVVVFVDVQPAATLERIFLHRQSLEQSDLQRVTASCYKRYMPSSSSQANWNGSSGFNQALNRLKWDGLSPERESISPQFKITCTGCF